jgi:hypothetical protein
MSTQDYLQTFFGEQIRRAEQPRRARKGTARKPRK